MGIGASIVVCGACICVQCTHFRVASQIHKSLFKSSAVCVAAVQAQVVPSFAAGGRTLRRVAVRGRAGAVERPKRLEAYTWFVMLPHLQPSNVT